MRIGTCEAALINPQKGRTSPDVGPLAVMSASRMDLEGLCRLLRIEAAGGRNFFNSRLFAGKSCPPGISLAGPFMGAPYAALLIENLIAWGARQIIFLGWCGSISNNVSIGDIVLPIGAFADEGTSPHYTGDTQEAPARPSEMLQGRMRQVLQEKGIAFHEDLIWSMDAIYRETPAKIAHFQKQNAVAVEMELSALFNIGNFRNVDVGALLVVSDELAALEWRPGFSSKRFKQSRKTACEVISALCQILSPPKSSPKSKN